ncbi:MAG: Rrf2 family transcriptional regulator [Thermodesulfobacteriota bacterium]
MKMSTKGRYGLRVMMELANHYGHGPMLVEAIAKNQGISSNYIHLLVTGLKSAGLVRTWRGPSGGYELTKKPSAITALDVVSVLEGRSAPVECVSDASACPRAGRCAARDVWCEVATAMEGVLSKLTLEQLAARQLAKQEEPMTYDI